MKMKCFEGREIDRVLKIKKAQCYNIVLVSSR